LPCGFFLPLLLLHLLSVFPRLISAVAEWMPTILRYMWGPSANLECRSEMCCMRLAGNAEPINSPKNRNLGTIAQLCRAISSQLRHTSTIGKIVKQQYLLHMSHNIVNFGPLAAEIGPVVWATPANFNGFRVLAALLHSTPVLGVSQTLRR